MKIRHIGERGVPLFGKRILPGETREINPGQWVLVERDYAGMFEPVGGFQQGGVVSNASVLAMEAPPLSPPPGGEVGPQEEVGAALIVLGLDEPVERLLEGAGVVTVEKLHAMGDEELLAIKGIGPGTLRVIREALAEPGYLARGGWVEGGDDDATD